MAKNIAKAAASKVKPGGHKGKLGKKPNLNSTAKKNTGSAVNKNRQNRFMGKKANQAAGQSKRNAEEQDQQNQENEEKNAAQSKTAADGAKELGNKAKKAIKAVIKKIPIAVKVKIALIILAVLAVIFIIVLLILFFSTLIGGAGAASTSSISYAPINGEYKPECTQIEVKPGTDRKGNPTEGGTFDLETYVEGVVNAEVGGLNNIELYKAFAISARTYVMKNHSGCSILNSETTQRFKSNNISLIKEAVEATKGRVLMDSNGNLLSTQYDAFCTIAVDDDYYTLKQRNQKVPRKWADGQSGIIPEWKEGKEKECHGNGASQWGAYYLAEEMGATYINILNYYYYEEETGLALSSSNISTAVDGLNIKVTTSATYTLDKSIGTFLSENGSDLSTYNDYIKQNVTTAGAGTREGVVVAAVSMINYLYDNYNTKLPYYYNGNTQVKGVSSSVGDNRLTIDPNGKSYNYVSFDDGGLVSWAIKNGGYNFNKSTPEQIYNMFLSQSCSISSDDCVGKAGDLLVSKSHAMLIVYYDDNDKLYYVAEATEDGITINARSIFTKKVGNDDGIVVNMDQFYNSSINIDRTY